MSAVEAKIIFIGPPLYPAGPKSGGQCPPHPPVASPMVEAQSCGTILWLCDSVERTTARVNWKTENLSLHYAKAPQPIDTKIGVKYYVSDIYQHTKLHHNLLNSFFPHVREENA